MHARSYAELIPVPRIALHFPLELPIPNGFVAGDPKTWPRVEGRLEYVGGRLYYMPPCGDRQQDTTADVLLVLGTWRRSHPEFIVGGNEAGMLLGGDARGADAAVWQKKDVGQRSGKFRDTPPALAVEVEGRFEDEAKLRAKAKWYLSHGVKVVWLLFPGDRRVLVVTSRKTVVVRRGRLPAHPALPDLVPRIDELFEQISE